MIDMAKYGLPEKELKEIRKRDKDCVYCGNPMPDWADRTSGYDYATIEHLYPPGNDPKWVCYCCNRCNIKHKKPLRKWFKDSYCLDRAIAINEDTVADPIKRFLKSRLKEYYMMWLDGPEHKFIYSDKWKPKSDQDGIQFVNKLELSEKDRKHFDKIAKIIIKAEFKQWYKDRKSRYVDGREYWLTDNVMYRRSY